MSSTGPAAVAPDLPEPAAGTPPADRSLALSDRLNPILVREVLQAMKGRAFLFTVLLALLCVVMIAIGVGSSYRSIGTGGREAFQAGLAVLAPLLVFVVPMHAYQAMRLEMRSGIVEQLLLTELRPARIVAGKLLAALVQFVLYIAVLAPLLATSYLLRGVDLPTIGLALFFAILCCVAATAFAISAAAQGALPQMQGLANLAVATGLGLATMGLVGYTLSGEVVRDFGWLLRSPELPMVLGVFGCGCAAGTVLCCLAAQASLSHAFENRSTGFRVFLFAMPVLTLAWLFGTVDAGHRTQAASAVLEFLALLGAAFGVFMVTEQTALSPRVRAHVPANGLLAVFVAPFLPGRGRGLLCIWLYFGLLVVVAMLWLPELFRARASLHAWELGAWRMVGMTIAYSGLYLAFGSWLRGRLPQTVQGNFAARVFVPLVLLLCCTLPVLVDVLARRNGGGWHPLHFLNPFYTIGDHAWDSDGTSWVWVVAGVAAITSLLQLAPAVAGLREVQRAAADRRARAAAGPEGTG